MKKWKTVRGPNRSRNGWWVGLTPAERSARQRKVMGRLSPEDWKRITKLGYAAGLGKMTVAQRRAIYKESTADATKRTPEARARSSRGRRLAWRELAANDPERNRILREALAVDGIQKLARWNQERGIVPTSLEVTVGAILDRISPGYYAYCGNGDFILGGKCPDFVNTNGKKILVEVFGSYWHPRSDEETRTAHFAKFGFKTIVVWDRETNDPVRLEERLRNEGA